MPRLDSEAACDRPQTIKTTEFLPILEDVWQQPSETSKNQKNLNNVKKDLTGQYTQETQMTNVPSQTWPPKGVQPQNYVTTTEQPPGNQIATKPVSFFSCSNNFSTKIHETTEYTTTTLTGDTNIPPLTITTTLIEERLLRDEETNELYLPITSTVVFI